MTPLNLYYLYFKNSRKTHIKLQNNDSKNKQKYTKDLRIIE